MYNVGNEERTRLVTFKVFHQQIQNDRGNEADAAYKQVEKDCHRPVPQAGCPNNRHDEGGLLSLGLRPLLFLLPLDAVVLVQRGGFIVMSNRTQILHGQRPFASHVHQL